MQYSPIDKLSKWTIEECNRIPILELAVNKDGLLHWPNAPTPLVCEEWDESINGMTYKYYQIYEDGDSVKEIPAAPYLYSGDKRGIVIYKLFRSKDRNELYAFEVINRSIELCDLVPKWIEEWERQKLTNKKQKHEE
jgi:hypothetical protein